MLPRVPLIEVFEDYTRIYAFMHIRVASVHIQELRVARNQWDDDNMLNMPGQRSQLHHSIEHGVLILFGSFGLGRFGAESCIYERSR